jgi:hypothetical protein
VCIQASIIIEPYYSYDIQEMDRTVKKQEDIEAQEIKKEFDVKTPPKV